MDTFETYRPLMFSIAYRMLGSAMEAEDIVQEAYLRYQATPESEIRSPQAFLSTIVTRLCLNQLQSARSQREMYIGPWLPEPILTSEPDTLISPDVGESISMAFLVLLEKLSPLERAVFLLREVFDYEYAEIAEIVGREEAACRQLFSRAKKHITDNRPRFQSSPESHREILNRFMQAIGMGDLEGLTNLLAEDVTVWSDGGGKVQAATRPIYGREAVAKFVMGLRRFANSNTRIEVTEVNGEAAIIIRDNDQPMYVITLETGDGRIQAFRSVGNPDKLRHI
jgi:RNA polymerase sigma-70 factor, ECF subfamily